MKDEKTLNLCQWLNCSNIARGSLCNKHYSLYTGVTHGNGKGKNLTPVEKLDIARRMSRLENPRAIAKLYGITTVTVMRNASYKGEKK